MAEGSRNVRLTTTGLEALILPCRCIGTLAKLKASAYHGKQTHTSSKGIDATQRAGPINSHWYHMKSYLPSRGTGKVGQLGYCIFPVVIPINTCQIARVPLDT